MSDSRPPHILFDRPSVWVARFAPLIPPGEALDLACGGGRHARLLAGLGHPVLAVDRDIQALEATAGHGITVQQVDLERPDLVWPFATDRFAGIVVINYLHRPLLPHLLRSLAPDGVLIYETFAQGNEQFGKPSNPLFLLKPGELLQIVGSDASLRVIAFEDGFVESPHPAMVQRICVLKTAIHTAPGRLRL